MIKSFGQKYIIYISTVLLKIHNMMKYVRSCIPLLFTYVVNVRLFEINLSNLKKKNYVSFHRNGQTTINMVLQVKTGTMC